MTNTNYITMNGYQMKKVKKKIDKTKVKKKGYFAARKKKKVINNETIGMSLEKYMCDMFNIDCDIEHHRYQDEIIEKMRDSNIIQLLEDNNICVLRHLGKDNGPIDFEVDQDSKVGTLSAKTLKRKDGKICPQGGQPTYKSFDEKNGLVANTANLGRVEANTIRWNWLKKNIGKYLNLMQSKTFCCDFLLLVSNCDKNPKAELLKNKNYNFKKMNIIYSRENYIEAPHKKKPSPATAEFSTTVKWDTGEKCVTIGEFQFHKSSRKEVKFRFAKSLFY